MCTRPHSLTHVSYHVFSCVYVSCRPLFLHLTSSDILHLLTSSDILHLLTSCYILLHDTSCYISVSHVMLSLCVSRHVISLYVSQVKSFLSVCLTSCLFTSSYIGSLFILHVMSVGLFHTCKLLLRSRRHLHVLCSNSHAARPTVKFNFFFFSNFSGCVAVVVFYPKANLILILHSPDLACMGVS